MAVTIRALLDSKFAENAQTTQYTAPSGTRSIIDKFTGTNISAGVATLTVNLVAAAGSASTANQIVSRALAAGEAYTFPEVAGHILNASGFISTNCNVASAVVIRVSGREVQG